METWLEENFWVFFALFAAIWVLGVFLITRISRWPRLARQFPAPDSPVLEERKNFERAEINGVRYKGAITIGRSEEGLYLKPFWLFGFLSKPILIPWAVIRVGERPKKSVLRSLYGNMVTVRLDTPEKDKLKIPEKWLDWLWDENGQPIGASGDEKPPVNGPTPVP